MSRLVINISSSANWRRRPVGIIRVERELANQLSRLAPGDFLPVVLDNSRGKYVAIPPVDFSLIASDDWVNSIDASNEKPLNLRKFKELQPRNTDRFISVGSDWSFNTPDRVDEIYGGAKVLIAACYDLIPIIRPEYTPGPEFFEQFVHHYTKIRSCGRSVFAISENSKNDLIKFWQENDLNLHAPPIHVVPLAGKKNAEMPKLTATELARIEEIKATGPYIIYVSTLEPRKNHQILLDVWRNLFENRGEKTPHLLLVGMRGWGCDDLVSQMSQMAATRAGRITWLEGINDSVLAHLYKNALFSVFPSLYEGWGLAATESMSYGRACVVSNNSSLQEATRGLAPALHPLDFPGWLRTIERLVDDSEYRESLEQKIARDNYRRTWDDFGDDFFRSIIEMP